MYFYSCSINDSVPLQFYILSVCIVNNYINSDLMFKCGYC